MERENLRETCNHLWIEAAYSPFKDKWTCRCVSCGQPFDIDWSERGELREDHTPGPITGLELSIRPEETREETREETKTES